MGAVVWASVGAFMASSGLHWLIFLLLARRRRSRGIPTIVSVPFQRIGTVYKSGRAGRDRDEAERERARRLEDDCFPL